MRSDLSGPPRKQLAIWRMLDAHCFLFLGAGITVPGDEPWYGTVLVWGLGGAGALWSM